MQRSEGIFGNPSDPRRVEFATAHRPNALDDVDVAVSDGRYALASGLGPARDALALECA